MSRSNRWPGICTQPRDYLKPHQLIARPKIYFRDHEADAKATQGNSKRRRKKRRARRSSKLKYPLPKLALFRIPIPPGFEDMTAREFADLVGERLAAREAEIRAEVKAAGRSFLGAPAVRRQDPFSRPSTDEPIGKLNPHIKAQSRPLPRGYPPGNRA